MAEAVPAPRPMLGNGEALRVDVEAPGRGGGARFEPRSAEEAQRLLLPQVSTLVTGARALEQRLRGDRIYIEARLLPNYLAASAFPGSLLASLDATPVGSRVATGIYRSRTKTEKRATRQLILAISDDGLTRLEQLIAEPAPTTRTARNAFEELKTLDDIRLAAAITRQANRAPNNDMVAWEAVLHPDIDSTGRPRAAAQRTVHKWHELVRSIGGEVPSGLARTIGGMTFTAVRLPADQVETAHRFNPLRVMRPMPAVRRTPRLRANPAAAAVPPPILPTFAEDAPRVAVFDGGLAQPSAFFPDPAIDLTGQPEDSEATAHGTAVTAAATFGLLRPGGLAAVPSLPVDSYRVLPEEDDDFSGKHLLASIVAAVEASRPAIVNLSVGPELAIEDDQEPNEWTSTLDSLAYEHGVLFVVAAGNTGKNDEVTGLNRVQVPADMVNGVSVGAVTSPSPEPDWRRADYSSRGPGRAGSRVQPVCAQFGGSASDYFPLLQADGHFGFNQGTSFAAPLVTHALAELAAELPVASPDVLRAFAVHFAEAPTQRRRHQDDVGYGRAPLSFLDALACTPDELHLLYVDDIVRGELIGYQLPVPRALRSGVELDITLAFTSPVDPAEAVDYTQASIGLTARLHEDLFRFTSPSGVKREIDRSTPEALQLIRTGWRQSQEPVTTNLGGAGGGSELWLRESGKWETLRHAHIPHAKPVQNPRLELSYITRTAGALDRTPSTMPYALIVTARDRQQRGVLYDTARAQFQALRPLQQIRTRPRLRT
jgi:hypothetical protein